MLARRWIVTVLDAELRNDRMPGDRALDWDRDPAAGEVFLAEEQLHPLPEDIFRQIDAVHRRTLEFERLHPAHAPGAAR